jgi:hypothetical protein
MTGVDLFYVETNNPTMLTAGYTFSYFPVPDSTIYYRSYDQTPFWGGELTQYSHRRNDFSEPTAKYIQVPIRHLHNLNLEYTSYYSKFVTEYAAYDPLRIEYNKKLKESRN